MTSTKNNGARTWRRKKHIALIIVITALIAAFIVPAGGASIAYAVSVGGEDMILAGSRGEIMDAVKDAEAQAADILGYDPAIADSVDITAELIAPDTETGDAGELTDILLSSVDGISKKYAVTVDGTPIAALPSEGDIKGILSGILDAGMNDNTISAAFKEDVSVGYMYVSDGLPSSREEISRLLTEGDSALTVVTREIVSLPEVVPYETVCIDDDTMYSDEIVLEQAGRNGISYINYLIERENGTVVSSVIGGVSPGEAPVDEIIRVGILPGSRTDSTGEYIWPAEGRLTSYFGYRSVSVGSSYHKGIDIAAPLGSDVLAADGGEVIYADWMNGYGNFIMIEHDNGDVTCYGHLSKILIDLGDRVYQGQLIASMGSTGVSSGSHLHFEVRPGGGSQADPLDRLP